LWVRVTGRRIGTLKGGEGNVVKIASPGGNFPARLPTSAKAWRMQIMDYVWTYRTGTHEKYYGKDIPLGSVLSKACGSIVTLELLTVKVIQLCFGIFRADISRHLDPRSRSCYTNHFKVSYHYHAQRVSISSSSNGRSNTPF